VPVAHENEWWSRIAEKKIFDLILFLFTYAAAQMLNVAHGILLFLSRISWAQGWTLRSTTEATSVL
jgi:hypothetical protein